MSAFSTTFICAKHTTVKLSIKHITTDQDEILIHIYPCPHCMDEWRGKGYKERRDDEFKRGDPGHPDNDMGM